MFESYLFYFNLGLGLEQVSSIEVHLYFSSLAPYFVAHLIQVDNKGLFLFHNRLWIIFEVEAGVETETEVEFCWVNLNFYLKVIYSK